MRSVHEPVFNHDDDANDYDADVRNEKDPIRAAYHDVLAWVISEARIDSSSRVLELGSGTGNLSCHLDQCGELVCVDLSERMEAIARSKSGHILNRRFIKADIFVFFSYRGRFGLGINLTFCDSFRIVAPQCVKRKRGSKIDSRPAKPESTVSFTGRSISRRRSKPARMGTRPESGNDEPSGSWRRLRFAQNKLALVRRTSVPSRS